jgi:hypothetical protein
MLQLAIQVKIPTKSDSAKLENSDANQIKSRENIIIISILPKNIKQTKGAL